MGFASAAPMDPALTLAVEESGRAALAGHLGEVQSWMTDFQPAIAKASAHAGAESVRAALAAGTLRTSEARVLLSELDRAWNLANQLEQAWALVDEGRFEEARLAAPGAPTLSGLDDERGQLARHIVGLGVVSESLDIAADALAWGDFFTAEDAAVAAGLDAWSLHLDGLLSQEQLDIVEGHALVLQVRAAAPSNFLKVGAHGVTTMAIQYTELADEFSPELYAFARTLSFVEGTDHMKGYWTEVGNRRYPESTRVHPGAINVHRFKSTGFISDAFGRYQMLSTTWSEWARQADVPVAQDGINAKGAAYYDMSPEYQDLAVLRFLQRKGIEELLQEGKLHTAMGSRAAHQWTSVPGALQPNGRTPKFVKVYEALLKEERAAAEDRISVADLD